MSYTTGQLAALYAAANGLNPVSQHVRIMAAIGTAESSGNPDARNPSSSATGLWQVLQSHSRDPGWPFGSSPSAFASPVTNARMAEYIYQKQGYGAWSTYTSGAYLRYLSGASVPTTATNANFIIPNLPNIGGLIPGLGGAVGGAVGGAAGSLLGIPQTLFDANLWRRIGIGLAGVAFILVGLVILLRRPIGTAVATGAKVAPLVAA